MKTVFWIWTILIAFNAVLVSVVLTRDKAYSGTDLNFQVSSTTNTMMVEIPSGVITIEAASNEFFLLRKLSGETLVAVPADPPLAWDYKTYYVAGPTQIPGGEWLIQDGSPTIHITADAVVMTVTLIKDKLKIVLATVGSGFLLWVFGILLVRGDD